MATELAKETSNGRWRSPNSQQILHLVRSPEDVFGQLVSSAVAVRDNLMTRITEIYHPHYRTRGLLEKRGLEWVRENGAALIADFEKTEEYEMLFDDIKGYQHRELHDASIKTKADLFRHAVGGAFAALGALWLQQTFPERALLPEDHTVIIWNRLHPYKRLRIFPFRGYALENVSVPDMLHVDMHDGQAVIRAAYEFTIESGTEHLNDKPRAFQIHKNYGRSSHMFADEALLELVVPADSRIAQITDDVLLSMGAGVMEVPIMTSQVKALVEKIIHDERRSVHFMSKSEAAAYKDPRIATLNPLELAIARGQARALKLEETLRERVAARRRMQ